MDFRALTNKISILLGVLIFLGTVAWSARVSGRPASKPLTKGDVIDLLKGDVLPQRVGEVARERGIDFEVTSQVEGELRRAGATDDLIETLRNLAPKQHGIQIEVTPGDAEVYVDDERQGKTSPEGRLKITTLAPGQHRIRVALEGYRDFETTVEIKRGEMTRVVTQLQSSGSATSPGGPSTTSVTDNSGRALMARVIEGLGGKAKVDSIKSFQMWGSAVFHLPQGDISAQLDSTGDFRGFMRQIVTSQMGVMTNLVTPSSAMVIMGAGPQVMSQEEREETLKGLWRNGYFVCQHVNDPSFSFTPGGDTVVDSIATKVLDVRGAGADSRWFIDPSTGWIMRASYTYMENGVPIAVVEDFQDWQLTSGFYIPLRVKTTRNGSPFSEMVVTKLEVNPYISPVYFNQ